MGWRCFASGSRCWRQASVHFASTACPGGPPSSSSCRSSTIDLALSCGANFGQSVRRPPEGGHYDVALIRAYIVDDERLAVQRLSRMLKESGRVDIVGTSTDPVDAVAFLNGHDVDVLFLDIQMPELNGFELLEKVDHPPQIVF